MLRDEGARPAGLELQSYGILGFRARVPCPLPSMTMQVVAIILAGNFCKLHQKMRTQKREPDISLTPETLDNNAVKLKAGVQNQHRLTQP